MDVVAMDTLSPVKRRLFNEQTRSSTSQPPNQTTLEHQLSPYTPQLSIPVYDEPFSQVTQEHIQYTPTIEKCNKQSRNSPYTLPSAGPLAWTSEYDDDVLTDVNRIFEAYESGYKHTEVQPQQTKQVYSGDANLKRGDQVSEDANEDAYSIDSISWTGEDVCDVVESDSEPEVVCFANLGDSDGDDGLSDCESIEKDDVLNSKNDDQNSVMRMAKDLREMMFHMPADHEIKLQVGQEKNDKSRLTAICADKGCEWRIHASVLVDKVSVEIRTLKGGDHKCKPVFKNLEVTSNWVAQKLYSSIINNPGIGSGAMSTELRKRFNTSTTKKRLYRAKKQVLQIADNDFAKSSYARLHDYGNIILTKNKGATVKIQQELQGTQAIFKRIFVSYDALRNGFMQGCRRFIGVDGCHLKTSFGGVLLSAVSLDANNGIFPLAFCICEVECKDSWLWFLGLLKEHMNIQNEMALTIMSDRQKEFRGLFWKAVRATNRVDFEKAMAAIHDLKLAAYKWLMDNDPSTWACHTIDPFFKTDHVTNNIAESWNGVLNEYRRKPIIDLLKYIRMKLMKRLIRRREKAAKLASKDA
ncbi:SWIM-type domain-containing protein [Citrus sinensis]|uniref:SWIM-type domain-containing protein n=1 Tax=Citrus sinensis TaxID=2711 RepID=A0ACB8IIR7_CITSI|nr:SWIM-type domain-containing protein [Citrus sinensis]